MQAALRQLDGKMDYNRLANDLGLSNGNAKRDYNAARMRWTRLTNRLSSGSKKAQIVKGVEVQPATPRKTPNGKQGKRPKRCKLTPIEDYIDVPIKAENAGSEEIWEGAVPETPS